MKKTYRIGIVGYGRMGSTYGPIFHQSDRWELVTICDLNPANLEKAKRDAPEAKVTSDENVVFNDTSLDAVALLTLPDQRAHMIRRALQAGFHVIAEKPIAGDLLGQRELLPEIERSNRLVAVNLFNRNAWYHHEAQALIAAGEIGKLAIIRICHMTPGDLPIEGHKIVGAPFYDCGMHYVDVARWYAGSEYDRWHAQGVRVWGESMPWWGSSHGQFVNGTVFEITCGFVYSQGAKVRLNHSSCELIGTHGVVRMSHDFRNVHFRCNGIHQTIDKTGLYGDKKLDVLCQKFAESLDAGRDLGLPTARDSVIAAEVAWQMLEAAAKDAPSVGTQEQLYEIARRRGLVPMKNGEKSGLAFTLTELLVVVAFISILLALLLPTLTRAKEFGNSVKCMNNLRQIGHAMMLYAGDNEGYALNAGGNGGYSGGTGIWTSRLYPYVDSGKNLYVCPSDPVLKEGLSHAGFGSQWSYGINVYGFGNNNAPQVRLTAVKNPAQTYWVADNSDLSSIEAPTLYSYDLYAS